MLYTVPTSKTEQLAFHCGSKVALANSAPRAHLCPASIAGSGSFLPKGLYTAAALSLLLPDT